MTGDQHAGDGDQPPQGPVPPHETLAALAAQIADIREKVTYLDAVIDRAGLLAAGDIRRRVSRLTTDLSKLASQVEAQAATLAKAMAAGPRAQAPTWAGLSPEAEKRASRSTQVCRVVARERGGWGGAAETTGSDMGKPPGGWHRATPAG